ncbi:lytic transglycosylase domain-containing protein [Pseudarthrobacter sp. MEB009]|uniref:coiled-coil domain-containing protein n=1 Tax=Pseudarthrobacter sp. MEB009 TaxID=3040326 RepID=UPI0025576F76|nr:lytic transglycosylase domain-containing protein [Pseudarthrobacter sp. MEB009]
MSPFVSKVRSPLAGGLLALILAGSAVLPPAMAGEPAPPSGYPSWEDVQQAKETEAGKATEIAKINELLTGLAAQAETLGGQAVTAAADYGVADAALQAVDARLLSLAAKTAAATADVDRHRKELGALAVQSYKTGGTNTGFFVALDALEHNNVQGLNVVQMVGDKTAALVERAASAAKVSESLREQEQAARTERERLTAEAATKLKAARDAQAGMARQIDDGQRRGTELTAQLASLKGTTAAVEGEYRQGVEAEAAYQAAQDAKRKAAEELARRQADDAARAAVAAAAAKPAPANPAPANPAPANPAPAIPAPANPAPAPQVPVEPVRPPVVVPSVPGGAVNDPAGAKNYAAGRLAGYGWGQEQFPCLSQLWMKESGWRTTATNPSSGAYGIAQSLPAGKYASAGSDWLTNYRTQIEWGLGYISGRYGSPCAAWNHSIAYNWY